MKTPQRCPPGRNHLRSIPAGTALAFCLALSMLAFWPQAAGAQDAKTAVSTILEKDQNAVVAELFTSQGCSSCPPAQEYLFQLARRADVITLEYHVDYWDQLKTWLGGSWKDLFSDPAWTERQVAYNRRIMDSDRAFTPEIVIDGRFQSVGSKKSAIGGLIGEAQALKRRKFSLSSAVTQDGGVSVVADGPGIRDPAQVVLLRLQKEAATDVKGGENKGAVMRSHNIVRGLMVIGTWEGGKQKYAFKMPDFAAGESCAVLLQDPETMQVLAGALCAM